MCVHVEKYNTCTVCAYSVCKCIQYKYMCMYSTLYMMHSCAHVHTAFYRYMELYEAIHVHVCKLDISLFSLSPSALPTSVW